MLRITKGFLIKDLVAPTICIVFYDESVEWIDNRNELLISNTAITAKKPLMIKIHTYFYFLIVLLD
jgi:hypothetical protein